MGIFINKMDLCEHLSLGVISNGSPCFKIFSICVQTQIHYKHHVSAQLPFPTESSAYFTMAFASHCVSRANKIGSESVYEFFVSTKKPSHYYFYYHHLNTGNEGAC